MTQTLGIILAGGSGTRLAPMTTAVSKQLLPIYDKPMIHYPLTTLIEAGIRDVVIISQPENLPLYTRLLGNGSTMGMNIGYHPQPKPEGLAQAFLLVNQWGRERTLDIADHYQRICLVLGDNLFHGDVVSKTLKTIMLRVTPAADIFVYQVKDPQRYGVAEIPEFGNAHPWRVSKIVEKPLDPQSNWAVPGLYVYPAKIVLDYAKALQPSKRGELEITDLNNLFAEVGGLYAWPMGRGAAWLDSGTPESLLEAAQYVRAIQERQGISVGEPMTAAHVNGWV